MAGRESNGGVFNLRAADAIQRFGTALLPVGADHGGMAAERDIRRGRDRIDPERVRASRAL